VTPEGTPHSSTADIVLDDRAYAAWTHVALERAVDDYSFGVKDVIDVAGMPTSCGFEPWRTRIASEDATVVRRLRAAGWDPVGKTHTAQFAYADPPPTLNPLDPTRTPGGSSTGSAVAVARGHVRMALATQTGGSTIRPAAYCGVVGMKPSFGVVPVDGIHPVARSLDTIGIIARSVATAADAARASGAIDETGWTLSTDASACPTLATFADVRPLLEDAASTSAWLQVLNAATDGPSVRRQVLPELDLGRIVDLHVRLMAVEAWPVHAEAFATPQAAYYGPKLRRLLELGRELSATTVAADHLEPLRAGLSGLEAAVPDDGVLLMPATVGPPPERHETGSSRLCMPWTVLGMPVVVVPWRLRLPDGQVSRGGIQVVGQHGSDAAVLTAAAAMEQKLHVAGMSPPAAPA